MPARQLSFLRLVVIWTLLLHCLIVNAKEPIKIIPIGDSITQGGHRGVKEYTYRWPLARMLADEGVCFEFIGSHRNGMDADARWPAEWNDANEGYYGQRTAYVRDKLASSLRKLPAPDIALIHLGTNDASGSIGEDIVNPLRGIVRLLRISNPKVTVMIALIPSSFPRSLYLHFRIRRLVTELNTNNSAVVAVDHYTGWVPSDDTFDGVHPNLRGQRKMAEAWLQAMKPYLRIVSGSDGC